MYMYTSKTHKYIHTKCIQTLSVHVPHQKHTNIYTQNAYKLLVYMYTSKTHKYIHTKCIQTLNVHVHIKNTQIYTHKMHTNS